MLFGLSLLPFIVLFVLLVAFRRPAWQAAPVAYAVTVVLALTVWRVSGAVLVVSVFNALIVFVEVLLIVTLALLLLNVMIETGTLDTIQNALANITSDPRVLAMLLAWGLVCFIEGIAGFGTPAVLAAPTLVYFGVPPLKAVVISLIGNSTAVPFGAAGTPVIIGFAGLGLSAEVTAQTVFRAAAVHGGASVVITCFLAYVVTRGEAKGRFRQFVPFAVFSALAFSVPYVLIAWLIGPELPSILGGIVALVAIATAAHRGFLLGPTEKPPSRAPVSFAALAKSFAPFLVMSVALIVSRTIPGVRQALREVTISFGAFRGIALEQDLAPFYTPYFYLALALLSAILLFRVRFGTLAKAAGATVRKVRLASVVLIFIIALTQLLLMSEMNPADLPSIPEVLGTGFASILGGGFVMFSAFLGAFGSFMTGSATVSNLLFAGLQFDAARTLAAPASSLLSLQLIGAGLGNMVSLHNIAMATGAAGVAAREGEIMRETIVPVVAVCLIAGCVLLVA